MKERTKSSRARPDGSSNGHLASACLCLASSLLPSAPLETTTTQLLKSDMHSDRASGTAYANVFNDGDVNRKFPLLAFVASPPSPLWANKSHNTFIEENIILHITHFIIYKKRGLLNWADIIPALENNKVRGCVGKAFILDVFTHILHKEGRGLSLLIKTLM